MSKKIRGISITSGHITATEKRVITYMLEHGMTDAKSGRIEYHLSGTGDEKTVTTIRKERSDYGKMLDRKSVAKFVVK